MRLLTPKLCRDALSQLSKDDLVEPLRSHDSLAIHTVLESLEDGHLKVLQRSMLVCVSLTRHGWSRSDAGRTLTSPSGT